MLCYMIGYCSLQFLEKSLQGFFAQTLKCVKILKKYCFFTNYGSNSAPIQDWLKYKIVARLLGTYLGTRIFKIGSPSQKLQKVPLVWG